MYLLPVLIEIEQQFLSTLNIHTPTMALQSLWSINLHLERYDIAVKIKWVNLNMNLHMDRKRSIRPPPSYHSVPGKVSSQRTSIVSWCIPLLRCWNFSHLSYFSDTLWHGCCAIANLSLQQGAVGLHLRSSCGAGYFPAHSDYGPPPHQAKFLIPSINSSIAR